jgi:hypothetical protein
MYDYRPNLIIGFHGCDESTAQELTNNPDKLVVSKRPHDWLGHGFYFWENNFERAYLWAEEKKKRGDIEKPAVVGAIINLGYCCDFIDSKFTKMIGIYYELMVQSYNAQSKPLPKNNDRAKDVFKDKIIRNLDCAVIEFMHSEIYSQIKEEEEKQGFSELRIFDSTRGVFTEGGPAFHGAGIQNKSHIQVCIRNSNCIKGFFLPRTEIDFMQWLEKQEISV